MKRFEDCLKLTNSALMAYHRIEEQDELDRMEVSLLGVK
jgi:hypothetical protein